MKKLGNIFLSSLLLVSTQTMALTYLIPATNQALIGELQYGSAQPNDTVVTMAERYDVGFNEMENANPHLNMVQGFGTGTVLKIPSQHLLPEQGRKGIVVNLPEMRMYYYPEGTNEVRTYPIGIGKIGKTIPIAKTTITRKTMNPTWIPTPSIREFNLEQGVILPRIMPPGPDNPLGKYGIYMGIPTYLIHSTIFPESIGRRASFGCVRMYESDIKEFFPAMKKGIPVIIINASVKTGWQNDRLYMEAYKPLEEHVAEPDASLPGMVHMIIDQTKDQKTLIDWQLVSYINKERDGMPHEIGMKME